MFPSNNQIPINARPLAVLDVPALNRVDSNHFTMNSGTEVPNGTPLFANTYMSDSQRLQDEMEKIGKKMKQHEDNLKFLKTEKNKLDDAVLDLQVSLGKYLSSSAHKIEDGTIHSQSEEETLEQIMKHDKSAAGIFYKLKRHHGLQLSTVAWSQDVLGAVAVLGKIDDDNLSRLFSEFLGMQTMLALVCKTFEGIKALETYSSEGLVNKGSGIHGLGASTGQALEGRFLVICLENLRPYAGEILADDPQRRLDIPKPRLPSGEIPAGFLGYAVNMIHVDRNHLYCLTSSGCGLRETLLYNLFSRLQVYRTRAEMLLALPCISDGAVSLDGGTIKTTGVFFLGSRQDVDVRFPKCSERAKLSSKYHELETQMKLKKWEQERILEDMRREQAVWDQEKYNFSLKKQELLKFMADTSSYLTQHQMQMAARERQAPQ